MSDSTTSTSRNSSETSTTDEISDTDDEGSTTDVPIDDSKDLDSMDYTSSTTGEEFSDSGTNSSSSSSSSSEGKEMKMYSSGTTGEEGEESSSDSEFSSVDEGDEKESKNVRSSGSLVSLVSEEFSQKFGDDRVKMFAEEHTFSEKEKLEYIDPKKPSKLHVSFLHPRGETVELYYDVKQNKVFADQSRGKILLNKEPVPRCEVYFQDEIINNIAYNVISKKFIGDYDECMSGIIDEHEYSSVINDFNRELKRIPPRENPRDSQVLDMKELQTSKKLPPLSESAKRKLGLGIGCYFLAVCCCPLFICFFLLGTLSIVGFLVDRSTVKNIEHIAVKAIQETMDLASQQYYGYNKVAQKMDFLNRKTFLKIGVRFAMNYELSTLVSHTYVPGISTANVVRCKEANKQIHKDLKGTKLRIVHEETVDFGDKSTAFPPTFMGISFGNDKVFNSVYGRLDYDKTL